MNLSLLAMCQAGYSLLGRSKVDFNNTCFWSWWLPRPRRAPGDCVLWTTDCTMMQVQGASSFKYSWIVQASCRAKACARLERRVYHCACAVYFDFARSLISINIIIHLNRLSLSLPHTMTRRYLYTLVNWFGSPMAIYVIAIACKDMATFAEIL